MSTPFDGTRWRNWSGLEEAVPQRIEEPSDVAAVVDAVRRARRDGTTVKMIGTGHSFTAIAAPEHTLLTPGAMSGIVAVDREAMTVTARAGTPLKELNLALERLGLSLHNMGDIAEQTLAGATSTGTHGTGGVAAGLAAQLAALESYDDMVAAAHHVDMYWFPHTDAMMVKQNVRTDLEPGEQDPPSPLAAW